MAGHTKFRGAVVGLGQSGVELHCQPIARAKGLELSAVCDTNAELAGKVAKEFAARPFSSLDSLLNDGNIQFIVIATPTAFHAEMGRKVLSAGKHLILEKPIAINTAEADMLIRAAREKNLLLTVYHNRRWYANALTVKKILAEGLLGDLLTIESRIGSFSGSGAPTGDWHEWRRRTELGGGTLLDFGPHLVDEILVLTRSRVKSLYCTTRKVFSDDAEDYFKLILQLENGVLAEVECGGISKIPPLRYYVRGTRGSLTGEPGNHWGPMRVVYLDGDRDVELIPKPVTKGDVAEAADNFYKNWHGALAAQAELAVKPEEAREVIHILEAARQSAAQGRSIAMP